MCDCGNKKRSQGTRIIRSEIWEISQEDKDLLENFIECFKGGDRHFTKDVTKLIETLYQGILDVTEPWSDAENNANIRSRCLQEYQKVMDNRLNATRDAVVSNPPPEEIRIKNAEALVFTCGKFLDEIEHLLPVNELRGKNANLRSMIRHYTSLYKN